MQLNIYIVIWSIDSFFLNVIDHLVLYIYRKY